jgi:DNA-binding transcriptional LysR family regulator
MEFDWVMPAPDTLLRRVVVERLGALGLPPPAQRMATASFLLTLALLQQSNAIAPLSSAVAQSFTSGDRAPYCILPIDLGIVVPPFGLMTRIGAELPPAARAAAAQILEWARRMA